ncbi:MAG TPA: hypothetical protein VFR31_04710 [Thermoanaerobaculia bacterium]|nr:hypothetical protein [Thermoanaerobaculia bacterium]
MRSLLLIGLLAAGPDPAQELEVHLTLKVDMKRALQAETGTAAVRLSPETARQVREKVLDETAQVIRRRLADSGIRAQVEPELDDRILVEVPRIDDPSRVRKLLREVASLEIRLIRWPEGGGAAVSREVVLEEFNGQLPPDLEILEGDHRNERGVPIRKVYYAAERRRLITGRDVQSARQTKDDNGDPAVTFRLHPEPARRFSEVTGANVGAGLAIVLDGWVVSAPRIIARIPEEAMVYGIGAQHAADLAVMLSNGPLPASVELVEEHVIPREPPNWRLLGLAAFAALAAGLYFLLRPRLQ